MTFRLLGAACVILGCGGFGFMITANMRREMSSMRQLIYALEFIECELAYRMVPLAQLSRLAAAISNGCVKRLLSCIAEELELQQAHNVEECICNAIVRCPDVPALTVKRIKELGKTLGKFDLNGQIKCICGNNAENKRLLEQLNVDYITKIRSYKTLSLCAGAALVILLI